MPHIAQPSRPHSAECNYGEEGMGVSLGARGRIGKATIRKTMYSEMLCHIAVLINWVGPARRFQSLAIPFVAIQIEPGAQLLILTFAGGVLHQGLAPEDVVQEADHADRDDDREHPHEDAEADEVHE